MFKEQDIDIHGYRLCVRSHPATDGGDRVVPLVFLHEGLGCIAFWRDVPEEIGQQTGRAALVFDRRGYGRSSPCRDVRQIDYLHREARVYLPALLDALAIQRAVLIGHSDGGSIALLFGALFPDRCAGIVTEAAPWFRNWRIDADITGVICPVLAIQGQDDPYGDPAQLQAITSAVTGPVRSLKIPGCGHTPHLEARSAFVAAVTGFVAALALND